MYGRDHLRVCGADSVYRSPLMSTVGSSPRVRSRLPDLPQMSSCVRIISACAEQTRTRRRGLRLERDHLRVCGADDATVDPDGLHLGSSPRVRSRQLHMRRAACRAGIISACAEQTCLHPGCWKHCSDHLRVCGADWMFVILPTAYMGSSPRVRSRLHRSAHDQ